MLQTPGYGNNFLAGRIEHVWEEKKGFKDHLSVMGASRDGDVLTRLISAILMFFKTRVEILSQGQVHHIPEARIKRMADGTSCVVSSVFSNLALIVLSETNDARVRLGVILLFTTLFAVASTAFSNARRIEIFATTTA